MPFHQEGDDSKNSQFLETLASEIIVHQRYHRAFPEQPREDDVENGNVFDKQVNFFCLAKFADDESCLERKQKSAEEVFLAARGKKDGILVFLAFLDAKGESPRDEIDGVALFAKKRGNIFSP